MYYLWKHFYGAPPPKKNYKEELLPKAKAQSLQQEGYVKTAC